MSLFRRKLRDGTPVLTPLPKVAPLESDAEWHARVAGAARGARPRPASVRRHPYEQDPAASGPFCRCGVARAAHWDYLTAGTGRDTGEVRAAPDEHDP
jgi:hypothetical protein